VRCTRAAHDDGGGSVQLGACVGAMCEVVASVCSGFNAVYE
jgi:hypothetical protein